jgi:hypothetical protein
MATELPRAPGQETQRREGPGLTRTGPGRTSHSAAPGSARMFAGRFARQLARALNGRPAQLGPAALRWTVTIATWAGALLMLDSGIIHLRLWADGGYRGIAVIGPLFLVQGVAGILLAVVLGVFRRLWLMVAGAVLMGATAAGLLLSVHVGLFGYRESLTVPYAGMSLVEEAAGAVLLAGAAVLLAAGRPRSGARTVRVWPPAG